MDDCVGEISQTFDMANDVKGPCVENWGGLCLVVVPGAYDVGRS
jgi:hypothetical protein